ncbi:LacI family DNA-binding transcriptional regulator [Aliamphritea hakodatensis]|uniref:LacI family DNA-binding transcriptional regulator n=1 Tax=Aliamphritea hakodatensis TaxID=2895352 RepID=UPI0022FD4EA7|nr:LacI family DNA-binding transcriptional regulator [Aliamphritea hakodatensis]
MTTHKNTRLADVAELAGVSLGSASKALSAPESVKPKTLSRVQAAVQQLGYVRNGAARALASKRTHSIGAIFPTINNPIFADAIQAIQKQTHDLGYQLLISSHEYDPATELSSIQNLIERGVEGMLLIGTNHDESVTDTLRSAGRPYILMWSLDECSDEYCVGFYNRDAGTMITRHLLELGHQHFAVITGPSLQNDRMWLRTEGIQQLLKSHGLNVPDTHIISCPLSLDGGRSGLQKALKLDVKPTAVICLTDILALGACAEARDNGLIIPRDISIAGIDNNSFSSVAYPALTTIHVPGSEIGKISARNLINRIEGKDIPRTEQVQIELIVRESTGQPG